MTAANEPRDESHPVPNAARFRKRTEPLSRGRQTWTTLPAWVTLTAHELDALPVGARRSVSFVPGVYVGLVRTEYGWTLLTRHGIPSDALAGIRSAPRVPIDPEGLATPDAAT